MKEYLRLCLQEPNALRFQFKRVLAMTFTNKAAAEMKSRVIEQLNRIKNGKLENMGDLLCKELGLSAEELQRRADIVLSSILHHYSDFALGTIDSFTHRLLKTFAHDLELPVNFNVELDEEGFNAEVVHELIGRTGEDPLIGKLLTDYVLMKADDNSSWDPELLILNFSKMLHKENSALYVDQLLKLNEEQLNRSNKHVRETINSFQSATAAIAQKALTLIEKAGLQDNDFHYKKNGPQNFFKKVVSGKFVLADTNGSYLQKAIREGKWFGEVTEKDNEKTQLETELSAIAVELVNYIRSYFKKYALCKLIDKQIYPLLLLKKIQEIILLKKEENRLVFISEFNRSIFNLVQHEPAPFIYERLGERYRHFLLDEFQDTSSLQWMNILPLIDNSLANGWYNLLVGDGKQSIYRWRNANVKQFTKLPHIELAGNNPVLLEREHNLQRNFKELLLDTNYRSLETIVEFNNHFFSTLSSKILSEEYASIYSKSSQKVKAGKGGYVSVHTYDAREEDSNEANFLAIKYNIQSALESGFMLRDICVLCRTNQQAGEIARFLMQEGIPLVSSESLLLRYNTEVQTLVAGLKYLENSRDTISAAQVLHFLHRKSLFDKSELHQNLLSLSKSSLFDILKNYGIDLSPSELKQAGLADSCVLLVRALGLGELTGIHIRFFLDEVNTYIQKENSSLPSFLFWWEKRSKKAPLIIPQDTNAVKIMTIHSSKGLEFPVVILPYCNWKYNNLKDDWIEVEDPQLELPVAVVGLSEKVAEAGYSAQLEEEKQAQILENLNLLYVAFTRAAERLHIICKIPGKSSQLVNSWVMDHLPEAMRKEGAEVLEIGKRSQKVLFHKEEKPGTYLLGDLRFSNSIAQIAVRSSYLHGSDEAETAKREGVLLHWVLSEVKSITDLKQALNSGVSKGFYTNQEAEELHTKLEALLQHPLLLPCFQPGLKIKTEVEILSPGGTVLRPDRIVFFENETVIIDYKSGREISKKHEQQIQEYADLLRSMGYPKIRKLLVYTEDTRIVELN